MANDKNKIQKNFDRLLAKIRLTISRNSTEKKKNDL